MDLLAHKQDISTKLENNLSIPNLAQIKDKNLLGPQTIPPDDLNQDKPHEDGPEPQLTPLTVDNI